MHMKKVFLALLALQVIAGGLVAQPAKKPAGNLAYVDPRIGNVGTILVPTRPTVQLPNQMMRFYPLRSDYLDDQITTFPLIIVSHRNGEAFGIKPCFTTPTPADWRKKMPYDHDLEVTKPWYYSTYLVNDDATVEFVPGKKTGVFRFSFPPSAASKVLLFHNLNRAQAGFRFLSPTEITGTETYHGDISIYLYGRFSTPGKASVLQNNLVAEGTEIAGQDARCLISFPASAPARIDFSYAVSFVSAEQARKNYDNELGQSGFDLLQPAGEAAWAKVMQQIRVQGGTEAQKRSFYTALYRCYERMVDITEDGRYYSGFDKKIHTTTRPFYVDDWTWDTYLAHHPLRAILNPAQEEDMLNSYVAMYEQSGWMPTFPLLYGDNPCMNGFHSSVMILDDYRKGLRNFDVAKAYEGMRKNATEATMLPWRNGPKTALDDVYLTRAIFLL